MRTAQPGDRIQVHYVKRLQDGSVASSRGRAPLELTVGVDHPRLPGLGSALIGLAPGERVSLTVPAERAYGLPDPARVHRWPRRRFPAHTSLQPGKLVQFTDSRGRRRRIRILRVTGDLVVVDTNHRWAGQVLELEVNLVAIYGPETGAASGSDADPGRPRVAAIDVDPVSLASLREAMPGWEIDVVNGASATSLARDWNPGAADLLVIGPREQKVEVLALCRGLRGQAGRAHTPLLVLVAPGQEALMQAALSAGADSCLVLPIHVKELAGQVSRALGENRPGRHTLDRDQPQADDLWRDDGGQG